MKAGSIRVFKLISGEEIIGEVFNHFDREIELKSPATIVIQQTERGVGVGLMPYMAYATGNIHLHRHAIASDAEPDAKMVNEYNRIFGSGIEVVPASALAGLK
jgi:hypothetical protein